MSTQAVDTYQERIANCAAGAEMCKGRDRCERAGRSYYTNELHCESGTGSTALLIKTLGAVLGAFTNESFLFHS